MTFWKASESKENALIRRSQSDTAHIFTVPSGQPHKYYFTVAGLNSQEFTTPSPNQIYQARATISPLRLESGRRISFDVDGLFVNSVRITATKNDGTPLTDPVTRSLRNGINPIAVDLPCVPNTPIPVRLLVVVTGAQGEVDREEAAYSIACPAAPPARVRFNAVSFTPATRSAAVTTSFTDAPVTVFYRMELRSGGFIKPDSGSCLSANCTFSITGLEPGRSYSYLLSAAPNAEGPWQAYVPGAAGPTDIRTIALARVVEAPTVAFSGNGESASAKLNVRTDRPSRLQMIFTDSASGLELTTSPTPSNTLHQVALPSALVYRKVNDREFRTSFRIVVIDASDNSTASEIPFSLVANFTGVGTRPVLNASSARLSDFARDYGPQLARFVKAAAPLVIGAF